MKFLQFFVACEDFAVFLSHAKFLQFFCRMRSFCSFLSSAKFLQFFVACDKKTAETSHLTHTTKTTIYINATSSIFTELDAQCGNQGYIRELQMMGITVPEMC